MKKLYVILMLGLGIASLYAFQIRNLTPQELEALSKQGSLDKALMHAIDNLDNDAVNKALSEGARPNIGLGHLIRTASKLDQTNEATINKALAIISSLKRADANLNQEMYISELAEQMPGMMGMHGYIPSFPLLHAAIFYKVPPAIIEQLISLGADIDKISSTFLRSSDSIAVTPLMMAAWQGNTTAFELLLRHGADFTIHNDLGHDVTRYINMSSKKDELLKILETYKKEIHAAARAGTRTNPQGWGPSASIVGEYLAGELEQKTKEEQEEGEE
ncbi:MAG: hypothetical protein ACHQVS_05310 [Candidatus Babeliales bacterium]